SRGTNTGPGECHQQASKDGQTRRQQAGLGWLRLHCARERGRWSFGAAEGLIWWQQRGGKGGRGRLRRRGRYCWCCCWYKQPVALVIHDQVQTRSGQAQFVSRDQAKDF
ncbi:unnamed protein product, partial [Scytosiphon promiscuus]